MMNIEQLVNRKDGFEDIRTLIPQFQHLVRDDASLRENQDIIAQALWEQRHYSQDMHTYVRGIIVAMHNEGRINLEQNKAHAPHHTINLIRTKRPSQRKIKKTKQYQEPAIEYDKHPWTKDATKYHALTAIGLGICAGYVTDKIFDNTTATILTAITTADIMLFADTYTYVKKYCTAALEAHEVVSNKIYTELITSVKGVQQSIPQLPTKLRKSLLHS